MFIKIPFHENTGTYDSSGRKRTLERSVAATKSQSREKSGKSPEFRGFSHEKAGREARLSVYALQPWRKPTHGSEKRSRFSERAMRKSKY
ncbi:hypothetical protein NKJ90_04845 [Mesorhizobium sp. M0051]|uniref:hypothetical protein n=1 Tax=unclassified Mesorhizobium TaxID=325217 RepID=UPI0012EC4649|nr:hypothetical protein [Mesorhizobium sp. LNHC252B00]